MGNLTIVPGLRWFRRGEADVQFGADQRRAKIVSFGHPRLAELPKLLRGELDEEGYYRAAKRTCGADRATAERVLTLLRSAGIVVERHALLPPQLPRAVPDDSRDGLIREGVAIALRMRGAETDAPAELLRRRAASRVFVNGHGELADLVTGLLRSAGVGRVWGPEAARRLKPSFAVLVDADQPANLLTYAHAVKRLAHLAVARREGTVSVGPLVIPGRTPCLQCVDLYRRERDPAWATVASHTQWNGGGVEYLETGVRHIAAGLIVSQVVSHLDGGKATAEGGILDVRAPGDVHRSSWAPHARCGCGAKRRTPAAAAETGRFPAE